MLTHTISAASSVYAITAFQAIPLTPSNDLDGPTGDTRNGDQIMTVDVTSTANGAVGTLSFLLYDPNVPMKMRVVEATVTATTTRTDAAGTGGNYLCTVAFADTTNKIDLLGHGFKTHAVSSAGVAAGGSVLPLLWYLGASSLGGLGTLTVGLTPTRQS